ncbi:MAG: T9SS type A sorting domain-containing protein [Bacteroidetes bacterium]|nr:T9SS type A sorting domain-containing protein [Bacteroidota bacterium]
MKKFLLAGALLISFSFYAQNLVLNPGFEDTLACPNSVSQLNYAANWITDVNTPDYYNTCDEPGQVGVPVSARGYQPARTGNAFAGEVNYYTSQVDYREMFHQQLSSPLVAGVVYNVGMYVIMNEDHAMWAVDGNLGIYISNTPINSLTPFAYTPQIANAPGNVLNDSLNWTAISGTYTAVGGEQYITIGSFIHDSQLTIINRGGSYPFTSYAIDDVWVIPDSLMLSVKNPLPEINVSVYPDPVADVLNVTMKNSPSSQLLLYNSLGEIMLQKKIQAGKNSIDVSAFANGIYFVNVSDGENSVNKMIVVQH